MEVRAVLKEIVCLCAASVLIGIALTLKLLLLKASSYNELQPGEGCLCNTIVAMPLILAGGLLYLAIV